jgi:3-dehydroquinate synthase
MYFLKSLSSNDIISGLGESLKLCLIGGQTSYNLFEDSYKKNDLETIIKISTLIKKSIIEYDELEKNERKALNYGHEIGHALESTSNYLIPHGIGVLYGIYIVNKLYYDNKYDEINNFILNLIPLEFKKIKLNYEEFVQHLINDKKNDGLNICFIVLDEIGKIYFKYNKLDEINYKLHKIFNDLFLQ